jgi:uncharacterized protein YacL
VKKKQELLVPAKPPAAFTKALAAEIVKNLTNIGKFTTRPFHRVPKTAVKDDVVCEYPIIVDTSVLIDGRILPIANSGFITGTLVIPQFILGELQHIADSEDSLRRAKGRRGLDVVNALKNQKANKLLHMKFVTTDPTEVKEVDMKLVTLAKRWARQNVRLLTVDFNLAHVALAESVKVLNVNDIAQALKLSLMPGEEFTVRITHEGKEREQGVGYLADGTMVVVDNARDRVGADLLVIVTKVHQTPAGQLFFARIK